MSTRKRATRAGALTLAIASAFTLAASSAASTVTSAGIQGSGKAVHVHPMTWGSRDAANLPTPLPTSQCLTQLGINCYSPLQYRSAYDLNPLYQAGITGKGKTILIVDSYGSPTIQSDLEVFDKQWGLPDTTVDVRKFGNVPAFDPNDSTMVSWAEETTLDVEYAHAIAPGAKIVLAETAVAETEGVTGLPEMMDAEKSLIDAGVPDVISQSFGATEDTFPGFDQHDFSSLTNLRYAYKDAAAHHVTVLASSGDNGVTSQTLDGNGFFPYPANSWPSADPLVTSIGGTYPAIDDTGKRLAPDVTGNDNDLLFPGGVVGGGGQSHVFKRPDYQDGVKAVVGAQRGTPDISFSATLSGAAWVYFSFTRPGWHLIAGTSESCPIMSGVVALADQVAGHRLGTINPALYQLGRLSANPKLGKFTGLQDVTVGDISDHDVTGPAAGPGYDMATGWGTIDGAYFVPALAFAASTHGD
ncbi:S53 family peptidase [Catenulispora subtropica]|uniref:Peptidase S53 domain-containing protein n=1 Tax=Catenulispora subtropica TaxID=450798 RepID=A0ABN2RNC9_9ACTN